MTNLKLTPSENAVKDDLDSRKGNSSLNPPLYLWDHLLTDKRGSLALPSGVRGTDSRKLLARTERYFLWPDEACSTIECALVESNRGRESYSCADLHTEKRRIKESAAPLRTLRVGGDRAYPGDGVPQPTAIIEFSPGCLQMWRRLDSEVPPATREALNRRLLAYDNTASGYFGNRDALTSHEVR